MWRPAEATDLLTAILDGDRAALFDLIFKEADVNEPNDVGNRPIHAAAFKGDLAALHVLLRAGADINALGARGRTALHVAQTSDNSPDEMTKALLDAGCNPSIRDESGASPLDRAPKGTERERLLSSLLLESWKQSILEADEPTRSSYVNTSSVPVNGHSTPYASRSTPKTSRSTSEPRVAALLQALEVRESKLATLASTPTSPVAPVSPRGFTSERNHSPRSSRAGSHVHASPQETSPRRLSALEFATPLPLSSLTKGSEAEQTEHAEAANSSKSKASWARDEANEEEQDGFWMTVDGARVFVPSIQAVRLDEEEAEAHEEEEEVLFRIEGLSFSDADDANERSASARGEASAEEASQQVAPRWSVQEILLDFALAFETTEASRSIGMMLRQDADGVRVSSVKGGDSPARLAGVKVHDLLLAIGTQRLDTSLDAVVQAIARWRAQENPGLLRVRRVCLSVVLEARELAAQDSAAGRTYWTLRDATEEPQKGMDFENLIEYLEAPYKFASCCTPEDVTAAVGCFNAGVDVLRTAPNEHLLACARRAFRVPESEPALDENLLASSAVRVVEGALAYCAEFDPNADTVDHLSSGDDFGEEEEEDDPSRLIDAVDDPTGALQSVMRGVFSN